MKRTLAAIGGLAVVALGLAACSSGTPSDTPTSSGPVTLSVSGWSLDTTPEFQLLADGFEKENPNVTVELKGYDPAQYNTLVTTDLAAGAGPDIITQKEVKYVSTFQEGGQLLEVSDVELPDEIGGASSYEIDGKSYGVPYRQDSWVLFYNKDLFDKAGVAYPDGTWTWDDYAKTATELTQGLASAGSTAKGAYLHKWQSTVQGFANAQAPGDILSGDYDYLEPFYENVLALQSDGDQVDYNTATANQLTYQGEFGKQNAAMLQMGTWYVATLIAQQAAGDADAFTWGIAPAPQVSAKTAGLEKTPVTFGDPTGFSINAAIDPAKIAAAKAFLAYAASEKAATSLAEIGITPALQTTPVVTAYFEAEGAPTDDLSKFAFSVHDTKPENPTSSKTAAIQGILGDLHTAVMSGSVSIDQAITQAHDRVANEVGIN